MIVRDGTPLHGLMQRVAALEAQVAELMKPKAKPKEKAKK